MPSLIEGCLVRCAVKHYPYLPPDHFHQTTSLEKKTRTRQDMISGQQVGATQVASIGAHMAIV